MARTDFIIRFTANSIRITEKDGSNVLYDNFDALGNWSIRVAGDSDLSDPDSQVSFTSKSNERSTAIAEWSEVTSVLVGGVEDVSNYANWQEFMDNFLTSFVVTTVSVGNLSGLATAANQSTLLTRFGAADGSPAANTMLSYLLQSRDLLTDIKTAVEALAATIDTGRILVTDQH